MCQLIQQSPFYNVFNKEVFLYLECVNQQNLGETERPYCVTLNPPHTPDHTLLKWTTGHPVPSVAASKASSELYQIQGKRGIWFCGAYQGTLIIFSWFSHLCFLQCTNFITALFFHHSLMLNCNTTFRLWLPWGWTKGSTIYIYPSYKLTTFQLEGEMKSMNKNTR